MQESPHIIMADQWVVANYPYNSLHLQRSLVWLDRIAPGSAEAVRLATLTHDMERAFPGEDQPILKRLVDADYHKLHAARSARIVGAWLREHQVEETVVKSAEELIRAHEDGGWPEANQVQAADSLSFLEVNIDLFLGWVVSGKRSDDDVQEKFEYSYERIQIPMARDLALPLYQQANTRLAQVRRGLKRKDHVHG